jgi:hypothetical protein
MLVKPGFFRSHILLTSATSKAANSITDNRYRMGKRWLTFRVSMV